MLQEIQNSNFETVIHGGKIAVIEFYSQRCIHCRRTQKGLEDLAEELKDQVIFGKIDIEAEPALADRLDVQSVPTILFFKDGEEKDRAIGFTHKLIAAETIKKL